MNELNPIKNHLVQETIDFYCKNDVPDVKKLEVIKKLADTELFEIAERFREFKFTSEKYRYKAAQFVASDDGRLISLFIQNFDLNKPHILKIASQALQKDTQGMVAHFENFHLNEEEAYPLALRAAATHGTNIVENFPKLGLVDPDKILNVAQQAFLQNSRGCSKYIDRIGLKEEKQRFHLLMIRLGSNPDKAFEWTQRFGITTPQLRFYAALKDAACDGWEFSANVTQWQIPEEPLRFELFKAAFNQNDEGAIRYLANYELKGENLFNAFDMGIKGRVFPLAKAVQKSGMDPKLQFRLALKYAGENPSQFLEELKVWEFAPEDKKELRDIAAKASR